MIQKEHTKGFECFKKSVEELSIDKNKQLYIHFIGEKDDKGLSWCSDCNEAEPFINQAVEKFAAANAILLSVDVGDRSFWKDMTNPFRGYPNIKLTVIPTLLRWNSVVRLEGDQCSNMDLLEMFFMEE